MAPDDDGQTLTELAAEASPEAVRSLLIGRAPSFMDVDSDRHDSFVTIVRGVTVEVVAITGFDPEGTVRALAVWAITVGAAAHIEASLAPEQVFGGEAGPAQVLKSKYLGVLAQLGRSSAVAPTGTAQADYPLPDDDRGLFDDRAPAVCGWTGQPWW